jgi:hypothetical protein
MPRVFFDVRSDNVFLFPDTTGRELDEADELPTAARTYVARLLSTGGVSFLAEGCVVEVKNERREIVMRVPSAP